VGEGKKATPLGPLLTQHAGRTHGKGYRERDLRKTDPAWSAGGASGEKGIEGDLVKLIFLTVKVFKKTVRKRKKGQLLKPLPLQKSASPFRGFLRDFQISSFTELHKTRPRSSNKKKARMVKLL